MADTHSGTTNGSSSSSNTSDPSASSSSSSASPASHPPLPPGSSSVPIISPVVGRPLSSHPPTAHSHSNSMSNLLSTRTGIKTTDANYVKPYVFLGGSCDPTTWRRDIAVPKLTKYKIPFFNPQINDWHPSLIALEAQAKEECDVLLFVIDSCTRAIASMLEATEYIMNHRVVVVVICDIPEGTRIDGEVVGARQLKDLNRARAFLCDIAARHQQHCDVFDDIESAIHHIIYSHPSQQQQIKRTTPTLPNSNHSHTNSTSNEPSR